MTAEQAPGEAVVIFREHAPAEIRSASPDACAATDRSRRLTWVFVGDDESFIHLDRGDPLFRIALGRVIAHELEHIRRDMPEHDRDGFFKAATTPAELTALGWGR